MLPAEVKFAAEAINAARKISELHVKAKKGTEPGFWELAKALQGAQMRCKLREGGQRAWQRAWHWALQVHVS